MEGEKKFVCWGKEVRTCSIPCISAINDCVHQVLSNGWNKERIFDAPYYDPQCVLGNTLAAYVVHSRDRPRALMYINVAKSHLEHATAYEEEVFEAVNSSIAKSTDDNETERLLRKSMEDRRDILTVCWGDEVKTSSVPCISAINDYAHQVLSNGRHNNYIFDAPKYDTKCVLANTLAAYVARGRDRSLASKYIEAAKFHQGNATPYEKAVLEAVDILITEDDDDKSVERHKTLLQTYPKDILSLKRAQVLFFYMGDTKTFLDLVEEVVIKNEGANYIHGVHAFALQEVGGKDNLEKAEKAGLKAFKINPEDAATHHALCHTYQFTTQFEKAVNFMLQCSTSWNALQSFMYTHNWWHVCLCYLEGYAPMWKVWVIHEHYIWKELEKPDAMRGKVYLNAIGLLLRVHIRAGYQKALRGFDPCSLKKHLDDLTQSLMNIDLHSIWKRESFLDILILWVLAYMNKDAEAEDLLAFVKSRFTSETHKKKQQRMHKALSLAHASYEYGKCRYSEALQYLIDDFNAVNYKVIGASTEQIDVYNEVYVDVLLKTKQLEKAENFVDKVAEERKNAPFLYHLLEKAGRSGEKAEAIGEDIFPQLPDYSIN